MNEYTLYLDESETANFNKETGKRENAMFVIAGLICKNAYHNEVLEEKLKEIKMNIWNRCGNDEYFNEKILHELEMSRAIKRQYKQLKCEYNIIFKDKHIYNLAYDMISETISSGEVVILAVCIDDDKLNEQYDTSKLNDKFQIAMNLIIENYFHFLNQVEGIGRICYESLPENQNERIMNRYLGIKYNGTMFYPAKVINSRIKGLEFKSKKENIAGLQFADFIPNSIGRHILNKHYTNNKERNVDYAIIESKAYGGNNGNVSKFGIKIIP